MKTVIKLALVPLSVALIATACESPGPVAGDQENGALFAGIPANNPPGTVIPRPSADDLGEAYVVCKTGPSSTFDISEVSPNPGSLRTITVNDGECVVAARLGQQTRTIQSVENVPAGVQLDQVEKTQLTCALGSSGCGGVKVISGPDVVTDPVTGFVGGTAGAEGLSGVLVDYFNSLIPQGGEGCTPRYFKEHAGLVNQTDQWPPTGFGQGDSYNDTFGVSSSFGGTLLEAVNRRGDGENSLGRHAVAALLNSAHPGVSYDLSTAQVIAAVQAAYGSGDLEGARDTLRDFNEQMCPLPQ